MNNKTKFIAEAAVIAALYTVLTVFLPATSGVIQVRISEALTILPCFTAAAIPGLFLGCLISGFVTGLPLDAIIGSMATLVAALLTRLLSKKACAGMRTAWICALPPILCNALIIPLVLKYVYMYEGALWYFALTVAAGEIISAGILGMLLYKALKPFFKNNRQK